MEYFQELSEQLKENGVNPADFLDSFNDILKKNDVSITDMGKAALLQKAAAAAGTVIQNRQFHSEIQLL